MPGPGRRGNHAIDSASITRQVVSIGFIDHPITS